MTTSNDSTKISIVENTGVVVADLDCGTSNPDVGTDICVVRDKDLNGFGEDTEKPHEITLTLGDVLTTEINSTQGDKLEVGDIVGTDDGDGQYFIRVSDSDKPGDTDKLYFEGGVAAGQSFTAVGIDGKFGSETYVHIFDGNGTLLQTINFHTSCSAPLVIGDQYGSISLTGAAVEGKDTGTIYVIGSDGAPGDDGVTYSILGGADADLFDVDPDTGVVTFKAAPDFENPLDQGGDNTYEVVVRATRDDGTVEDKPLAICVEDDCIKIQENTTAVIDLDCGTSNPDIGLDICVVTDKDLNGFGEDTEKPSSYVLTLGELSEDLVSSASGDALAKVNDKVDVGALGGTDDGDGSYYVIVSRSDNSTNPDEIFFAGTVAQGSSFVAAGSFGSETFVRIFASEGGSLLQTINFHTSCSSPLIIGDQYGSITLEGASLEGKDTGTIYTVGSDGASGDDGVTYSIMGGADAALFEVDPATGEVSFKEAPDFENPLDQGGDNTYEVVVRATRDDGTGFVDKPLEICVEDDPVDCPVVAVDDCIEVQESATVGADETFLPPSVGTSILGNDVGKNGAYSGVVTEVEGSAANVGEWVQLAGGGRVKVLADGTVDFDADGDGDGISDFAGLAAGEVAHVEFDYKIAEEICKPILIEDVWFGVAPKADAPCIENLDAKWDLHKGEGKLKLELKFDIEDVFGKDTKNAFKDIDTIPLEDLIRSLGGKNLVVEMKVEDDKVELKITSFLGPDGTKTKLTDQQVADVLAALPKEVPLGLSYTEDGQHKELTPTFCIEKVSSHSPIAFDLNGNGQIDVTGVTTAKDRLDDTPVNATVEFDIDGDGDLDHIEWLKGDGDGLLVDTNGLTDVSKISGVHLFGDQGGLFANGFEKLATRDTNHDGKISGAELHGLKLWVDDGDAKVEAGEFRELSEFGVTEITTSFQLVQNDRGEFLMQSSVEGECEICEDEGTVKIKVQGEDPLPGSLSGRYFCDTNDNDVDDGQGTDPGIAGVVVELVDANGPTGVTTTTDANGNYSFTGLAAGTYGVIFTDPGGVLAGKRLVAPNVDDQTTPEGTGDEIDSDALGDTTTATIDGIVVVAGQDTPDNDAGAEEIPPLPGSLSGRYFCDTNDNDVDDGQGTDPGIAGVVVELVDANGPTGVTTTTDANGNYSFTGLAAGTYGVIFTDPGGVLAGKRLVAPNVDDQTTPEGTGDEIDSDALGDTTTATIDGIVVVAGQDTPDNDAGAEEIPPLPGSLSGRYFCDTNDNDVDDGQGTDPGIAGVVVELVDANGPTGVTTTTDANGNYSFTGLAAGTYGVIFTDPGGVLAGKRLVAPNVEDQTTPEGTGDEIDSDALGDTTTATIDGIVVVAGQDTPDNDAGAEEIPPLPGSLSGRYFCDTNDNDVDDGQATDPGIAGVVVELVDANGPTGVTTTTDANGNYSFTGLAAGTYGVIFTDPGGVLAGKRLVAPNVDDQTTPEGTGDEIDSDALGDTTTATIDGIVVVAGQDTPDNDAGAEEIPPLPGSLSGRYFCDTNDNDVDDGQGTDPGIAGVVVELVDANGPTGVTTTTDANGNYSFTGLAAGTYGVIFTDPGGVLAGKRLVAPNVEDQTTPEGTGDEIDSDALGDTTTATIDGIVVVAGQDTPDNDAGAEEIPPLPGSLSGRYFCDTNDNDVDDGQATDPGIAGVVVELVDANGPTGVTTTTDANGNYSFTGLAAGTYGVIFTDPGGVLAGKRLVAPNVDDQTTPEGTGDEIDSDALGDTTTATIDGIVVVAGQDTPDNDAGAEEIPPLPAGLGDFVFNDRNRDGIQDAGEEGIDGVEVKLLDAGGAVLATTTTGDDPNTAGTQQGYYSFTGLAAGAYKVMFVQPDGFGGVSPVDQGGDDAVDSDGNPLDGLMTGIITLDPGEFDPTIDQGFFSLDPVVDPADVKVCYDELATVMVAFSDPDSPDAAITEFTWFGDDDIEGTADDQTFAAADLLDGETLGNGVVVTLGADGKTFTFDGESTYADLLAGEEETDFFRFTVEDGVGGSASNTIDATFCGATDTLEKVASTLPASGTMTIAIDLTGPADLDNTFYDVTINGTGDARFDGRTFDIAYCADEFDPINVNVPIQVTFEIADPDTVTIPTVRNPQNLDLVNWILNNHEEIQAKGFTEGEIQGAIWGLLNGPSGLDLTTARQLTTAEFAPSNLTPNGLPAGSPPSPNFGSDQNAVDIIEFAAFDNDMDGFDDGIGGFDLDGIEAGGAEGFKPLIENGDIIGLILEPTAAEVANGNFQPFIIGIDLFEDCLCR